jgi:hypothetical protein
MSGSPLRANRRSGNLFCGASSERYIMKVKFFTESYGKQFEFQTEGNEAGLRVAESKQGPSETWASGNLEAQVTFTSAEWRQVYFALRAQRDAYTRSFENADADDWEEQMFLTGEIAAVTKLLYDMELNFTVGDRRLAKAFLNI